MAASDPINPSHYKSHPSGVEANTIMRHMTSNIGQVIKYVWRAGLKEQSPAIQDLEKTAWYLADEIERVRELQSNSKVSESACVSPEVRLCDCNQGRLPCTCKKNPR